MFDCDFLYPKSGVALDFLLPLSRRACETKALGNVGKYHDPAVDRFNSIFFFSTI